MKIWILHVACCTILALFKSYNTAHGQKYETFGATMLNTLSSKKVSWKPKINPAFIGKTLNDLTKILGLKPDYATRTLKNVVPKRPTKKPPGKGKSAGKEKGTGNRNNPNVKHDRTKRGTYLPVAYDWRQNTNCQSFSDIRYQTCGDCYAVSAAAVMSDRYCLYTFQERRFSAKQIVACLYGQYGGCEGGYPEDVMAYYYKNGVASGGDPQASIPEQPGCLAYGRMSNSVACSTTCSDGSSLDLKRAGTYHTISSKNVTEIQEEIYIYGSVVGTYEVFQDFYYLGDGVYQHSSGYSVGYHAVRIIGWGVENGVPYWLCANQWGTGFAEGGYFKILRGYDECHIETSVTTVYPIEAWQQ